LLNPVFAETKEDEENEEDTEMEKEKQRMIIAARN
jgi:hypothetical protein